MNVTEIKAAVDAGMTVHWKNAGYRVTRDAIGQYHVVFTSTGDAIGLTGLDGTLEGDEQDFFVAVTPDMLERTISVDPCDGDEPQSCTVDQFFDDNAEGLSLCEMNSILALPIGGVYEGGGGASAAWKVTRVS